VKMQSFQKTIVLVLLSAYLLVAANAQCSGSLSLHFKGGWSNTYNVKFLSNNTIQVASPTPKVWYYAIYTNSFISFGAYNESIIFTGSTGSNSAQGEMRIFGTQSCGTWKLDFTPAFCGLSCSNTSKNLVIADMPRPDSPFVSRSHKERLFVEDKSEQPSALCASGTFYFQWGGTGKPTSPSTGNFYTNGTMVSSSNTYWHWAILGKTLTFIAGSNNCIYFTALDDKFEFAGVMQVSGSCGTSYSTFSMKQCISPCVECTTFESGSTFKDLAFESMRAVRG